MRLLLLLALAALCAAADPANRPLADIVTSKGTIRVALYADEAPLTVANFLGLADGTKPFTDPTTNTQVTKPFYDGLTFHRVIAGFMIQGGDPLGTGAGGPGFAFADEINPAQLGLDQQMVLDAQRAPNPALTPEQFEVFREKFVGAGLIKKGFSNETPQAELIAGLEALMPELQRVTLLQLYTACGYQYSTTLPPSHAPKKGCLAMANAGPGTNGSQFFITLEDTPHLAGRHTVFGEVVSGQAIVEAIGAVPVGPGARPLEAVTIISIRSVPAEPAAKP